MGKEQGQELLLQASLHSIVHILECLELVCLYACACVCMLACGNQRMIFNCSQPCYLRQGFSLDLQLTRLPKLAIYKALGLLPLPWPVLELQAHSSTGLFVYVGSGN